MHPSEVLFQGKHIPSALPVCDHYAGSAKLIAKAIALQKELGPLFDITCDCEDGAAAGDEAAHARMVAQAIASPDNLHGRIGARVHDLRSSHFEQDVRIICQGAAQRLAFLMLPKAESLADVEQALETIGRYASQNGRADLPLHVLIETHGALAQVHAIAALPGAESLPFGIMDFVSDHLAPYPRRPCAARRNSPTRW